MSKYLVLNESNQPYILSEYKMKDYINLRIDSSNLYNLLKQFNITNKLYIEYNLLNDNNILNVFSSIDYCFDHLLLYVKVLNSDLKNIFNSIRWGLISENLNSIKNNIINEGLIFNTSKGYLKLNQKSKLDYNLNNDELYEITEKLRINTEYIEKYCLAYSKILKDKIFNLSNSELLKNSNLFIFGYYDLEIEGLLKGNYCEICKRK